MKYIDLFVILDEEDKFCLTHSYVKNINYPNDSAYLHGFIRKLDSFNTLEIALFLDFHYEGTPNKKVFLQCIECDILEPMKEEIERDRHSYSDFSIASPRKAKAIEIWLQQNKQPSPSVIKKGVNKPISKDIKEKEKRNSTTIKYAKIKKSYLMLTKKESLGHDEAIKILCEKFKSSVYTIDRALGKSK